MLGVKLLLLLCSCEQTWGLTPPPARQGLVVEATSRSSATVGALIQEAQTVSDLLQTAEQLWLPTDRELAPHLLSQRIHHEKRLRWSSQILGKLGLIATEQKPSSSPVSWDQMERVVLAASIPFGTDRAEKEGRYLKEALCGIHSLVGTKAVGGTMSRSVLEGLQTMFHRTSDLANLVPLPDAVEMRWACRGIQARLGMTSLELPSGLESRTSGLPFDVLPACLEWGELWPKIDAVNQLQNAIPFHFDTIVTRGGNAVKERRATAWIAEPGIGALAYSGKLMAPQRIAPVVRDVMNIVEDKVLQNDATVRSYPRPFFDCALCNFYPEASSGCKFHTDPEHGSHWERLTCVVAAGDPRRFAFRPIPGVSSWNQWDTVSASPLAQPSCVPAVITLLPGDVVTMMGSCNDDFHHAVYPKQEQGQDGDRNRVSLVLKRAISRNGGQKGHGVVGEGRRSRRRNTGGKSFDASRKRSAAISRKRRHR